mgnify:CR=1 FL=1
MKELYGLIVVGNQKAIVGFVLAFATVWLSKVGLSLDMTVGQVLEAGVSAVVVAGGVWFKRNW